MIARVRYRSGHVGESQRQVHLAEVEFEVLDGRESLVALCGESLIGGSYDVLGAFAGAPCVVCLGRSSGARPAELTAGSFKISGP